MTPRPTRRPPARAVVTGVAALAIGLSGCSAAGTPGAAAVIDGRVISEEDVQTVVAELPQEITQGQPIQPTQVVSLLIAEDAVEDVAREFTGVASQAEAAEFLRNVDTEADRPPVQYSEATLRVIAINLMLGTINQTDVARPVLQERVAELETADVDLNPRYGAIADDGTLQLGDYSQDWLVADQA